MHVLGLVQALKPKHIKFCTAAGPQVREKEVKRQTLLELVDYVNSGTGKFTEHVSEDIVFMLSNNLFRALPPSQGEHSTAESYDMDEEEPHLDPAWPHLQVGARALFLTGFWSGEVLGGWSCCAGRREVLCGAAMRPPSCARLLGMGGARDRGRGHGWLSGCMRLCRLGSWVYKHSRCARQSRASPRAQRAHLVLQRCPAQLMGFTGAVLANRADNMHDAPRRASQIVYEFLLRYVVSSDTDAKVAKRYIDQNFVVHILELFDSGEAGLIWQW